MTRETKILASVALLLGVIIAIVNLADKKNDYGGFNRNIFKVDTSQTDKIVIGDYGKDNYFVLQENSGKWTVKTKDGIFPADDQKINALKALIAGIIPDEVVLQKHAKPAYGIPDSSVVAEFYHNDKLLKRIYIGRVGRHQEETFKKYSITKYYTYASVSEKGYIYLVDENLRAFFTTDANLFRKSDVSAFDINKLRKIDIIYSNQTRSIKRISDKWIYVSGADTVPCDDYVSTISHFQIPRFYNSAPDAEAKRTGTIKIELTDKKITVTLYEDDGKYFVVSSQTPNTVFLANREEFKRLLCIR